MAIPWQECKVVFEDYLVEGIKPRNIGMLLIGCISDLCFLTGLTMDIICFSHKIQNYQDSTELRRNLKKITNQNDYCVLYSNQFKFV